MEQRNIALLFAQKNELSSAIANSSYGSVFPADFSISGKPLQLTDLEEEQIKNIDFPASLRFSVPVNLKDSKNAYLTLLESEEDPADDAEHILKSWGLANLYKEGDVTAANETTTTTVAALRDE